MKVDRLELERALRGRVWWLLMPAWAANVVAASLAGAYALFSLRFPTEKAQVTFFWLLVVLVAACGITTDQMGRRRLRTLRGLGLGTVPMDDGTLIAALREVHPYPDFVSRISLGSWLAAVSGIALGTRWVAGIDAELSLRIVAVGALFAPLAAALANLMVTRRAQRLVELLGAPLTPAQVREALPARTLRIGVRIMVFTSVLVVLPSAALIDLATRVGAEVASKVASAEPAMMAQAIAEGRFELYGKLAVLAVMMVGAAVLTAWVGGTVIAHPMQRVAEEANLVAKGVLRPPKVMAANDEVWAVTSSFALLQGQLVDLVGKLRHAGQHIGVTTEELVATSTRFEGSAAEQAASLNETSATTEELATSARQISANATDVQQTAQSTLEAAQDGQQHAVAFSRAVERLQQDNRAIAFSVERLQKRVQQIGRIVEFINTVADRTDLLALSAELEGTKAGEVGKGFTLVASEMRRLAENVIESTNEVEQLIDEIHEATRATVAATEGGLAQTESGLALAGQVTQALGRVVSLAQATSEAVRTITLATQQQQTGTDQLAEAMADILGITQQSLAATRQLTSANNELAQVAQGLEHVVSRFELEP